MILSSDSLSSAIRPMLDQPGIEYIGEIIDREKAAFLSGAVALLLPIEWPEPFGLVMACGTPVVGFAAGSVPEVVEDDLTGYVVKDETGAAGAVGRIDQISRERVRQRFEERFTARRMVKEYLEAYRSLMVSETPHLRVVSA